MSTVKSLLAAVLAVASFGALASEVTFFADPPSTRTRAEVIAELLQARASGELHATVGQAEATPFREAIAAAARHQNDLRLARGGAAGVRR